jgi:hypothetical protein
MAWLFDILYFVARSLFYKQAAQRAKAQGVLIYLKTLQVARLSLLGVLVVFALVQLILLGFIGALITGVWLLPQDPQMKLEILFGVFFVLFLVPLALLIFAFSEKIWYNLSGAEEMVEKNVG